MNRIEMFRFSIEDGQWCVFTFAASMLLGCSSTSSVSSIAADASAPTAEVDAGVAIDASENRDAVSGVVDASDAAPLCTPKNDPVLSSWPTPENAAGTCTEDQIQQFWTACFANSNTTDKCRSFSKANAACTGCLVGYETAAPTEVLGAIQLDGGLLYLLNVTGCMLKLAQTDGEKACAAAYADQSVCHVNACEKQCTDPDAYFPCQNQSDLTICKTQTDLGHDRCADWATPGSLFDRCWASAYQERYAKVARALCGPVAAIVSDAGDGG